MGDVGPNQPGCAWVEGVAAMADVDPDQPGCA
jgi:hypothetical protein